MPPFSDHFSHCSADYARYRPHYPTALFDWLAALAPSRQLAWDVATGNGQAARGLAERFIRVYASDASQSQLQQAFPRQNIQYVCEHAEKTALKPDSVDLVCIAQALHWLDMPAFFREVQRVLKPGGMIAAWCYQRIQSEGELNDVLSHYYQNIVGPYWPTERCWVEEGYQSIQWPFLNYPVGEFFCTAEWSQEELLGYLATWSAGQRYQQQTGQNPLDQIKAALANAWGEPPRRMLHWPLKLRIGTKAR